MPIELVFERSVVTRPGNRLPAKILKRAGQLRRLGPRGLARTAYVSSLGSAVYSVTDSAREIGGRIHRQKSLAHGLEDRSERLKERLVSRMLSDEPALAGSGGHILEWKFGTRRGQFVQSLEAMLDLGDAGCAVPRVAEVDWAANALATGPVRGRPFGELDPARRDELISAAEHALISIHQAGYVLDHVDADTLLFDEDMVVIADLRHAVPLAGLSRDMSVYLRDLDREKFNRWFGTRLLTANALRRKRPPSLNESASSAAGAYAPVVVRDDIHWGKIWNTDVGIGRWNFIMRDHLPIPEGGSVLDLGTNNGFNPLHMLRLGAASAVGIEIDPAAIREGEFLRSVYEWLDNRRYDFRYIHGSIGDLPSFNLPRFDVVTALCSLYYLEEHRIHEVLAYLRRLTGVIVLQCNTDRLIDRSSEETFRKASVEFALGALRAAGFANCELVAPAGYSRPLVIGRAS